jgi:hypothetical protein
MSVDYETDAFEASKGFTTSSAYLTPLSTPSEIEVRLMPVTRDVTVDLTYVRDEARARLRVTAQNIDLSIGKHSGRVMSVIFHRADLRPDGDPVQISAAVISEVEGQLRGKESSQFVFQRTAKLVNHLLADNWRMLARQGITEGQKEE